MKVTQPPSSKAFNTTPMLLLAKVRFSQLVGLLWLSLLAISILFSAFTAYQQTLRVSQYPSGCDAFGYLVMAKEVRRAANNRELPRFVLEAPQSRILIESLKSKNVPVSNWQEFVAPLGARYFPTADHIGVQYPPGTALALALFPEKTSVHGLNKVVLLSLATLGVVALVYAGIKRAWLSAGFAALTCYLGFQILGEISNMSFSINALLLPLSLAFMLLFIARRFMLEKHRTAWWAALCAGLLFGLATLIRLPVILLVPGCLVLLWPGTRLPRIKDAVIAFGLGLFCGGIVPLLIHQHRITGAWYLPTYSSADTSPPSLNSNLLKSNLAFYFANGPGSRPNWALYILCVGLAGLLLLTPEVHSVRRVLSKRRIVMSALTLWIVPTVFFLTHEVPIAYYQFPAIFGTALFVSFAAFTIETQTADAKSSHAGSAWPGTLRWAFIFLAILPGLATVERTSSVNVVPINLTAETYPDLSIPGELADQRAWVWSEELSGTLWYYANKPAFKYGWTDAQTRVAAFRLAFERGEPQYIIRDRADIEPFLTEIRELGGVLEQRGVLDGNGYYLIRWPEAGPSKP